MDEFIPDGLWSLENRGKFCRRTKNDIMRWILQPAIINEIDDAISKQVADGKNYLEFENLNIKQALDAFGTDVYVNALRQMYPLFSDISIKPGSTTISMTFDAGLPRECSHPLIKNDPSPKTKSNRPKFCRKVRTMLQKHIVGFHVIQSLDEYIQKDRHPNGNTGLRLALNPTDASSPIAAFGETVYQNTLSALYPTFNVKVEVDKNFYAVFDLDYLPEYPNTLKNTNIYAKMLEYVCRHNLALYQEFMTRYKNRDQEEDDDCPLLIAAQKKLVDKAIETFYSTHATEDRYPEEFEYLSEEFGMALWQDEFRYIRKHSLPQVPTGRKQEASPEKEQ